MMKGDSLCTFKLSLLQSYLVTEAAHQNFHGIQFICQTRERKDIAWVPKFQIIILYHLNLLPSRWDLLWEHDLPARWDLLWEQESMLKRLPGETVKFFGRFSSLCRPSKMYET